MSRLVIWFKIVTGGCTAVVVSYQVQITVAAVNSVSTTTTT